MQLIHPLSQNNTKENVNHEASNIAVDLSKLSTIEVLVQGSGPHPDPPKKKYSSAILDRDNIIEVNKSTSAKHIALPCAELLRYFGKKKHKNTTWAISICLQKKWMFI